MRTRSRATGFTLIELLIYLSLVSTALVVLGGIELTAQRTASLQGALVDIQVEATSIFRHTRRDLEDSVDVEADDSGVRFQLADGGAVSYAPRYRTVFDAAGEILHRQSYPRLAALHVEPGREGGFSFVGRFRASNGLDSVRRTFRWSGQRRREVAQ